jgi:membrane protease YdiL (CAAX protease family)
MKRNTFSELSDVTTFFLKYYDEIIVISFATLFIVIRHYHSIWNSWVSSFFYLGVLPILTILILLRKNPLDYGLRIGNYKLWLVYVFAFLIIAVPILYFSSELSSVREYYSGENFDLLTYSLEILIYMLGWEFIFRGFLLFGLKEKFKEGSILVQVIPFTILHLGKPEIETLSCVITGLIWGYIAYRGNSFWPAYIMHVVVNISNKFFVTMV